MLLDSSRFVRLAMTASLALFGLSLVANATPIPPNTFSIPITVGGDGTELTGTLNELVDASFGLIGFSGSLTYNDGTKDYVFNGSDVVNVGGSSGASYLTITNSDSYTLLFAFGFPPYAMSGSSESFLLCSVANPCDPTGANLVSGVDGIGQVQNGFITVTLPSETPEPSSIALLGTGVIGIAGAARRRFRRA